MFPKEGELLSAIGFFKIKRNDIFRARLATCGYPAAKQNMFQCLKQSRRSDFILNDIGIEVELAIVVKTDNVVALFMSQNSLTGLRSRHVDTRYHFIIENVEDGIVRVKFVKFSDNDSDIFRKNVNQEMYEKHVVKLLESIEDFRSD
jgi:hypothetical protein